MAKKILFCPRCLNRIKRNDEKCSQCGLSRAKMEEMMDNKDNPSISAAEETTSLVETKQAEQKKIESTNDGGLRINTEAIINDETKGEAKEEKLEDQSQQPSGQEDTSFEPANPETGIDSEDIGKAIYTDTQRKRHKHKRKKEDLPEYTVDEDGEYNIDTSDVTYLEGVDNPTYSVKKARGEVTQEKLKWWEIYKWADRMLAKRKIMKEVNKASYKIPYGISKASMLILCLLFGWMGAHDFYAKNYKRGWFVLGSMVIVTIVLSVPVLTEIMGVFVGGGLGFVVMVMWFCDFFAICFNKYKYRISKEEFISNLNVETRAKIGKKYINLDRSSFKAKETARQEKYNRKHKRKKNQ